MASSTCTKCGNHRFELKETSPIGSNYKFYFVQCASCGSPVGVVEYFHTGTKIDKLEEKINRMSTAGRMESIEHSLAVLHENVKRLFNRINNGFEKLEDSQKPTNSSEDGNKKAEG